MSHGKGFVTFFIKLCRWSALFVVPKSSLVQRLSSSKYSHSTHAHAFEGSLSISLQICYLFVSVILRAIMFY